MQPGQQKITQFDPITSMQSGDIIPVVRNGQNKRITVDNFSGIVPDGWVAAAQVWTYLSYSSITLIGVATVPSDATLKYSVGMRISFTQTTGGKKYGTIIAITSTTISFILAGGAVLTNEAMSTPLLSSLNAPFSGGVNLADEGESIAVNSYAATTKRWIDGKLIYKASISVAVSASGNNENLYNTVIPASATRIIRLEGGNQTAGADFHPAEYVNPNATTLQNAQAKVSYLSGVWQLRAQSGSAGTWIGVIYFVI